MTADTLIHPTAIVEKGAQLGAGARVTGPCVIELPTTTILLLEKQASVTDDHGNFLVETA